MIISFVASLMFNLNNYLPMIGCISFCLHSEYFQRTLLELYNSLIGKDMKQYGYILESGQLSPKITTRN